MQAEYRQRVNAPGSAGFGTPVASTPGILDSAARAFADIMSAFGRPSISNIPGLAPFKDILAETDPEQRRLIENVFSDFINLIQTQDVQVSLAAIEEKYKDRISATFIAKSSCISPESD